MYIYVGETRFSTAINLFIDEVRSIISISSFISTNLILYLHSENMIILSAIGHQHSSTFHGGPSQISWCKVECWHINVVSGIEQTIALDPTSICTSLSLSKRRQIPFWCSVYSIMHTRTFRVVNALPSGRLKRRMHLQLVQKSLSLDHSAFISSDWNRSRSIAKVGCLLAIAADRTSLHLAVSPSCQLCWISFRQHAKKHTHKPPLVRIIAATFIIFPIMQADDQWSIGRGTEKAGRFWKPIAYLHWSPNGKKKETSSWTNATLP